MEAIVSIVGIHQFKIWLISITVCTLIAVSLVVNHLLVVIIFDERVTLIKATRQEAHILKLLFVKHFSDASEHSLMKLLYGVIWVPITLRFSQRHGALAEEPELLLRFLIIFWSLKLIQSQKANVVLIFAVNNQFCNLFIESFLLAIVRNLKLCASWQESLGLQHAHSAVHDDEPGLATFGIRERTAIHLATLTHFNVRGAI